MNAMTRYIVSDPAMPYDGNNARDIVAPNVASAAEAYDTYGVLSMTGPDALRVETGAGNYQIVTMSNGRRLYVSAH